MLPDMSGMDVLRELREAGSVVPVILLTARKGVGDRVAGLHAGADDYLPKPIQASELLARIRAVTRRPATYRPNNAIEACGLVLDGLHAGADDYLPKPIQASELLARIRAVTRRPATYRPNNAIEACGLVLDVEKLSVQVRGGAVAVELTPKEALLLPAEQCDRGVRTCA